LGSFGGELVVKDTSPIYSEQDVNKPMKKVKEG